MLAVCSPASPQPFAADFATATSDLWHFRLGHPSHAKLSLLNKIVSDLAINKPHCCDICHLAKQRDRLFLLVLMFQMLSLIWFIVISGVLFLFLPLMDIDFSLPLWMITLDALGSICFNLRQKHKP